MRIALITHDKPKHLQVRLDNRQAHLAYIKETGVVEMAGPFLDDSGQMSGSLIILDVEDIADAEAWAEKDPYNKANLFESVNIIQWNKLIG
jgi:uncharacterized protein YciI